MQNEPKKEKGHLVFDFCVRSREMRLNKELKKIFSFYEGLIKKCSDDSDRKQLIQKRDRDVQALFDSINRQALETRAALI